MFTSVITNHTSQRLTNFPFISDSIGAKKLTKLDWLIFIDYTSHVIGMMKKTLGGVPGLDSGVTSAAYWLCDLGQLI